MAPILRREKGSVCVLGRELNTAENHKASGVQDEVGSSSVTEPPENSVFHRLVHCGTAAAAAEVASRALKTCCRASVRTMTAL